MLDDNTRQRIEETREKHEFLTFLVMSDDSIKVGVVQNENLKVLMFYDFEKIKHEESKRKFLELTDEWWWQSSQAIPVNSFVGDDFDQFQHALHGYPKKSITEIIGPTFSLQNKYLKRIKKKKIEIVNRQIPCEA